jgi:polyisoprenoid-binding protein YceI
MPWKVLHPTLRIKIFTEGALSAFGHDRVFDQPITVALNAGDDLDGATISVEGDLRQTKLLGHASDSDRAEILKRKDRDVLKTDVFPALKFEGSYKQSQGVVSGSLSLHGSTQRVELPVSVAKAGQGYSADGSLELDLRRFGISPYKALLGALRVKTVVEVMYSLELEKVV